MSDYYKLLSNYIDTSLEIVNLTKFTTASIKRVFKASLKLLTITASGSLEMPLAVVVNHRKNRRSDWSWYSGGGVYLIDIPDPLAENTLLAVGATIQEEVVEIRDMRCVKYLGFAFVNCLKKRLQYSKPEIVSNEGWPNLVYCAAREVTDADRDRVKMLRNVIEVSKIENQMEQKRRLIEKTERILWSHKNNLEDLGVKLQQFEASQPGAIEAYKELQQRRPNE